MQFNAIRMRIGLKKFHQLHVHTFLEFLRRERVAKQFLHVAIAVHHFFESIYTGLQKENRSSCQMAKLDNYKGIGKVCRKNSNKLDK